MPTGVVLRDVRQQLFGAAERILLRDGPSALTSRSVTDEAGVAKGVLHRHFDDFDGFLAELVYDRAARIRDQSAILLDSAGTGTVAGNIADTLAGLFGSVAAKILALVIFRDALRARLRETWPRGVPLIQEIAAMIGDYLTAERDLGRVAADADISTLAPMLVGAVHMQFAGRDSAPPSTSAVEAMTATALAAVLR